jgi:atypical dual specificity phosphatase
MASLSFLKTFESKWKTSSPQLTVANVCYGGVAIFALTFLLLQKKCFGKSITKRLTRIYFPLVWPLNYMVRKYIKSGNYWSRVDEVLFLGAVPLHGYFFNHVEDLYKNGVRGVINCQDEYVGPVEKYKKMGMKQLHIPIVDHVEPTFEELKSAIRFIDEYSLSEDTTIAQVYCHCKGGHGRSAAIAICWLMYRHGLDPVSAQKRLNSIRDVRKKLHQQPNVLAFWRGLRTDPYLSKRSL